MARRLGGIFLHAAHGPLAFAASCVAANQILKGIEELEPSGLVGGFERGVGEVARLVGVPVREVQALLPWEELQRAAARLRVTQPAAVLAWKLHAGQFGFLDVITQLTVDGRANDIRVSIERVAAKVRADDALAEPLLALSEDVGQWDDLVMRCRTLLDDGDALAAAWKRRRQRRWIAIAGAVVVILGAVSVIAVAAMARGRIEAALALPDGCGAATISAADRSLASNDEDSRIAAAERLCAETRAEAQRKQERAEAEERARADAERDRKAHIGACESLAAAMRNKAFDAEAAETAKEGKDLARRLATRSITVGDLGPEDLSLPCWQEEGLPKSVAEAFDAAFAESVLALPATWTQEVDASPRTLAVLGARKGELPIHVLTALAERAAREAETALLAGKPDALGRANRSCELARRVGMSGGASCTGVASLVARP
jgi:hypothetical protein